VEVERGPGLLVLIGLIFSLSYVVAYGLVFGLISTIALVLSV